MMEGHELKLIHEEIAPEEEQVTFVTFFDVSVLFKTKEDEVVAPSVPDKAISVEGAERLASARLIEKIETKIKQKNTANKNL